MDGVNSAAEWPPRAEVGQVLADYVGIGQLPELDRDHQIARLLHARSFRVHEQPRLAAAAEPSNC